MLMKSYSNILTLLCILFATAVQRTEGYSLSENEMQKTIKSAVFLTGALKPTASKSEE
jgi:hypothetical protein